MAQSSQQLVPLFYLEPDSSRNQAALKHYAVTTQFQISLGSAVVIWIGLILHFVDYYTDWKVAYDFLVGGHPIHAASTIAVVLLSQFIAMGISIQFTRYLMQLQYLRTGIAVPAWQQWMWYLASIFSSPMWSIVIQVSRVRIRNANFAPDTERLKLLTELRTAQYLCNIVQLLEATLEAIPQILLQIYFFTQLPTEADKNWQFRAISVLISIFSLATTVTLFYRSSRIVLHGALFRFNVAALFDLFAYFSLFLSRFAAIYLMLAYFSYYGLIAFGLHLVVIIIFVLRQSQEHDVFEAQPRLNFLLKFLLGLGYIVVFLKVTKTAERRGWKLRERVRNETRKVCRCSQKTVYYWLYFLENLAIVAIHMGMMMALASTYTQELEEGKSGELDWTSFHTLSKDPVARNLRAMSQSHYAVYFCWGIVVFGFVHFLITRAISRCIRRGFCCCTVDELYER